MLPQTEVLPETRRVGTDSSLAPVQGHGSAETLILDFWSPELWSKKSLLYQAIQFVITCNGNLSKLKLKMSPKFTTLKLHSAHSLFKQKDKGDGEAEE